MESSVNKREKKYELVVLLKPRLPENVKLGVENRIIEIINNVGSVIRTLEWGRKRLAYSIKALSKKYNEAVYVVYEFLSSPDVVGQVSNSLKANENVLRFLLVKKED